MVRRWFYGLWVIFLLAGCAGQSDVLPTAIDLAAIATNEAAIATNAAALTETPTPTNTPFSNAPTLPPTWTAQPISADTTNTPAPTSTSPPPGFSGTLYYILDEEAIVALSPDTGEETVIISFGAGRRISDLSLSPDGDLLAFIAPGNGSAREVYISSRDGSYIQPVSCLGFADIRAPSWRSDGQELAFFGAQARGVPLNLYAASWVGSGNCPAANNQRQLAQIDSFYGESIAYHTNGRTLYFTTDQVYSLNLTTGRVSPALTRGSRYGPDHALRFSPPDNLAYMQQEIMPEGVPRTGSVFVLDVSSIVNPPLNPAFAAGSLAQRIEWSDDGATLLVSSLNSVLLFNTNTGTSRSILTGLGLSPKADFSPSQERIAYLDADPITPDQPQIYIVGLNGQNPQQVTFREAGAISDLLWAD